LDALKSQKRKGEPDFSRNQTLLSVGQSLLRCKKALKGVGRPLASATSDTLAPPFRFNCQIAGSGAHGTRA
jgi:hypothetical protein